MSWPCPPLPSPRHIGHYVHGCPARQALSNFVAPFRRTRPRFAAASSHCNRLWHNVLHTGIDFSRHFRSNDLSRKIFQFRRRDCLMCAGLGRFQEALIGCPVGQWLSLWSSPFTIPGPHPPAKATGRPTTGSGALRLKAPDPFG